MTQLPKVTQAALRMLEMSTGDANFYLGGATLRFPSNSALLANLSKAVGTLPAPTLMSTKHICECSFLLLGQKQSR